jgi:SET and MYND domain-containing protein
MAASPLAAVRPSETLCGQVGLFATEDIPAGAEILPYARPLLPIVDVANLGVTCNDCFASSSLLFRVPSQGAGAGQTATNVSLKSCLGCRTVKYCSKVCPPPPFF